MTGLPPNVRSAIARAFDLFGRGRLDDAESAAKSALAIFPGAADALHVLGLVALSRGQLPEAEAALSKACRLAPKAAPIHSNRGLALLRMSKPAEALKAFDRTVALAPSAPEAHANRGLALAALGRHADAVGSFDRALSLRPEFPDALVQRAASIGFRDGPEAALTAIAQAMARYARNPALHKVHGDVLRRSGRLAEARAAYETSLALDPEADDVRGNLAGLLVELGEVLPAEELFRRVLPKATGDASLVLAAAGCALRLGLAPLARQRAEIAAAFGAAPEAVLEVQAAADYAEGNLHAALNSIERALALTPGDAGRQRLLASILIRLDRRPEAIAILTGLADREDKTSSDLWLAAIAALPAVPATTAEDELGKLALTRGLALADQAMSMRSIPIESIGSEQPFYLAYQDDDHSDLMRRYGRIVVRAVEPIQPRLTAASGKRDVVRVGIVSSKFRSHAVFAALVEGWIERFDRRHIEVIAFDTGKVVDPLTRWSRENVSVFVDQCGSISNWAKQIAAQAPDVLIYPELGMDPTALPLAAMRLAPFQVATWGHPLTSGLPTIDAFLSAEAFEPEGADSHYTEALIRLPGVGCYMKMSGIEPLPVDLEAMGIERKGPVFLCPGTPYKYRPHADRALVEIAQALGRCTFVMFKPDTEANGLLFDKLHARLAAAFAAAGLDIDDYVTAIGWQPRETFFGLMRSATAMLDTIGFSGFNTAMQAVENGLPIVTIAGRYMRGRLASGVLCEMGLTDIVQSDIDGYVALACRLAREPDVRDSIARRIIAAHAKVFCDERPIRAMERLFAERVASGGPSLPAP